jgi:hypothetical protein
VTLTSEAGASIFFTLDGTTPTTASTRYTTAIAVPTAGATLKYIGVDAAGNQSAVASQTYTVTPPAIPVSISAQPATPTNAATLSYSFALGAAAPAGSTTECMLSPTETVFTACSNAKSYGAVTAPIPAGTYTFQVRGVNGTNTGTAVSATAVVVDRTAPTVTASPAGGTFAAAPTVALASEAGASIFFTLDGTTPTTASTRYTAPIAIATAGATLRYIAVDTAGNQSPTASQTYTVTPPAIPVSITAQPTTPTNSATLSYQFALGTGAPAGSTMQCMLSPAETAFTACASPKVYGTTTAPIAAGTYTLQVRGVNGSNTGNAVSAAAVVVDRTAPSVTASPIGGTFTTAPTVTLSSEAGASIFFTLNGTTPTTASTRYTASIAIPAAGATLKYIGMDVAGNQSAVGSQTYVIQAGAAPVTTAPASKFVAGQLVATTNATPVGLQWSATAATGATVSKYELQRSTDGGTTFAAVTLPTLTTTSVTQSLAPGSYIYRVRATDSAGRVGAFATAAAFSVAVTDSSNTAAIAYTASFTSATQTGAVGGTIRSSSTTSATAKFTVTSTPGVRAISLISPKSTSSGKASIFVDGSTTAAATVDLFATATQLRQVAVTLTVNPAVTTHSILVKVTGTRNTASTGTRIDVDAFATLK